MVLNAKGDIWVGQRIDTPGDSEGRGTWWQMPQGGIDDGEEPRAAALRELFEETGMKSVELLDELDDWLFYDLPPQLIGKAWGGRYRGQKQRWYAIRFNGPESEINIVPANPANREFNTWRWAAADEIIDLIVPFKREVYVQVLARFQPLLGRYAP
jgi:putative (di)nucleoside polyphosphate hydrolase